MSFPKPDEPNQRARYLLAGIWLVYLGYPIAAAWQLDGVARVFGLGVVVAFAVVFLGAFVRLRHIRRDGSHWPRPPRRVVFGIVAALVALLVAAMFPLHENAFGFAVYIVALAGFMLPTREAFTIVVALMAFVLVVPLVVGWERNEFVAFQLAVAGFAAWGVSNIIIRNQQLAAAHERIAVLAVADERARLGRDVHDILGHSLTVITVKTELAQRLIDVDIDRAKGELADVERLAREALAGVRDTVGGLREVSLDGELANARTALVAAGIVADLPDHVDGLPKTRSQIFGWVLREGITNVVRHSGASRCEVRVTPTAIEITDDGRGFDGGSDGSGLAGLRERVGAAGGTLRLVSPERGFRLVATFPEVN